MSMELKDRIEALIQTRETKKRDLRGLYRDLSLMKEVAKEIAAAFAGKVDYVLVPNSFGMITGTLVADALGVGILPLSNRSGDTQDADDDVKSPYINHRDKARMLTTRSGQIPAGSRLLLVDDWVETAATMQACMVLAEEMDCQVSGIAAIGANKNEMTEKLMDSVPFKVAVMK